jgi:hypothetical protein
VQLPQAVDLVMSVSQPALAAPLQCAQPGAQDAGGTTQTPALQVTIPDVSATCGSFVQSVPQAPQFFGSVFVSVQALLQ